MRLRLAKAPAHELSWRSGAEGEEAVAASLERRCRPEITILHDRRIPGTRANIDHLAVTPLGVWVIDAKNHRGSVKIQRSPFHRPRLVINGRESTKLIEGLRWQVRTVKAALEPVAPDVPVRGALCLPRANLPLLRTQIRIEGFPVLYRKALARRLNKDGPFTRERVELLAVQLAEALPPA